MSKVISTTFTDTAISGVTAPSVTLPVINYDADFRMKSTAANEVSMVNTTTSLENDETIRISVSEIADIYKNAGISADYVVGSKQGYSLLVQVTRLVTVTDSTDPSYQAHLPLSAHLVLKMPKSEAITNATIQSMVSRVFGTLYEGGSIKALALLKGAISPKGL